MSHIHYKESSGFILESLRKACLTYSKSKLKLHGRSNGNGMLQMC